MRGKHLSVALVAVVVASGSVMSPVQASAPARAAKTAPANVVYTFNKIGIGGIVRDVSPPTHRRMNLSGNWTRTTGVNGRKGAVAFRAISRGVINRSAPLAPKRRAFAVAMTVKLKRFAGNDTPNLAQHGFYRDRGQWKVELLPENGRVRFRLKGKSGVAAITSRQSINDGQYHLVVCYRKKGKIGVIVDGQRRERQAAVGGIPSTRKVSIANKHARTADDQFRGNFDYFSIALGHKSVVRSIAAAPTIR